ncbi:MAG: ferrous iron transporter B [Planctomycetota bacterium]|nr:MAG: ferrous iron transporter B [Planctomycetota bacterium]
MAAQQPDDVELERVYSTERPPRAALLGQPNTGKTTLFNRLCGSRAHTSNIPGTTVESRVGLAVTTHGALEIMDLPGIYGLSLEVPESKLCRDCLDGRIGDVAPDVAVIIADATNFSRSLRFASHALRRKMPCVIAVTLSDDARRKGFSVNAAALSECLGCAVVITSGRTGEGVSELADSALRAALHGISLESFEERLHHLPPSTVSESDLAKWANDVLAEVASGRMSSTSRVSERVDRALTHPVAGLAAFIVVMSLLFASIFWLAQFPMHALDFIFGTAGDFVRVVMPAGPLRDLCVDGIIGGIAGTVVFLPQICLLFFLLSLLEDSGYLARAAFAADKFMRRFGLPGQAFVPLLSSHACALPGIMSTRLIPDAKDRLATILVAPFMSCTARLPVYVLLISLLFAGRPWLAGLAFVGCYATGAVAGLLSAFLVRRTLLKGPARPMLLEMPPYRKPSIKIALWVMYDRGVLFIKNAGTMILAICVVMWWLSAYPKVAPSVEVLKMRAETSVVAQQANVNPEVVKSLENQANLQEARDQQLGSMAGKIGVIAEPLFRPLGFDHQLTVAVLTSFLAREVFVSTLMIISSTDSNDESSLLEKLSQNRRADGTLLFTIPTAASLLVFFTLAMQCLPTLALVRRETQSWKWPLLQFVWMSGLAWGMAWIVRQILLTGGL